MNNSDVFISYRRKNVEFVKKLEQALRDDGREIWIDWEDIPPGVTQFSDEIKRGIEGADSFICVLSPDYLESTYCVDLELGYAVELNKRIVPILLEKFDGPPPESVGHINWVYFTPHAGQENSFEESLPKVRAALDTDYDHKRTHTKLLQRALEWQNKNQNAGLLLRGAPLQDAEDWLAHGLTKIPKPTQLQSDYIYTSRKASSRRQRITLAAVSGALVVAVALAVVAVLLGLEADRQRDIAETERQIAVRNAEEARSLALASGARGAFTVDRPQALALSVAAMDIDDPDTLVRTTLSEVAYAPGPVRQFVGHTAGVNTVDLNADGTRAVSGSIDQTVIVWDVTTGEALFTMRGHDDIVQAVAYNPTSDQAVSGDELGDVIWWDTSTGESIRLEEAHDGTVADIVYTPDGSMVISVGADGWLMYWDAATGELVAEVFVDDFGPMSLAMHPSGEAVAVGSCYDWDDDECYEGVVYFYELMGEEPVTELIDHTSVVISIDFSSDGTMLVSGSPDWVAITWDIEAEEPTQYYSGHTAEVWSSRFNPATNAVITGSADSSVMVWSPSALPLHRMFGHKGFVEDIDVSADGRQVISASLDHTLILWDVVPGSQIQAITVPDEPFIKALVAIDDEATLITGDSLGRVMWWSADGEMLNSVVIDEADIIQHLAVNPDETLLAAGTLNGYVYILDAETGVVEQTIEAVAGEIVHLEFSPDGTTLLSSGADESRQLALWDAATGDLIRRYSVDRVATFIAVGGRFLGDGSQIVAGYGGVAAIWETNTGAVVRVFEGHIGEVLDTAVTPDGDFLLTSSADLSIILWDIASGESVRVFTGHTDWIRTLDVTDDGTRLVSGSDDNRVIIWDIASGDAVRIFTSHADWVQQVLVVDGGNQVLSAADDSQILRWRIDTTDELLAWTQTNRLIRELTCEERATYNVEPLCDSGELASETSDAVVTE